jgi:hypothetical protein
VNLLKVAILAALALAAGGCATVAAPENLLFQAGFHPYVVRNESQHAQVRALPQGRISIVQRGGRSFYLYPSVARDQVYVGRRREYDAYVRFLAQMRASNEQVGAAGLEASNFEWVGGWKSWGPFFPPEWGAPLEYHY